MPVLHDYKCDTCGKLFADLMEVPECCGPTRITFSLWRTVAYHGSATTDSKGRRKAYGAGEDPLCKIELGLDDSPEAGGVRTTSEEQAADLRDRFLTEGDSPRLREKILEVRNDNLKSG